MYSVNYEKPRQVQEGQMIEALSEQLGSLQINEEASSNEQMDTEMSTAPAVNELAGMPRSMVLDPE